MLKKGNLLKVIIAFSIFIFMGIAFSIFIPETKENASVSGIQLRSQIWNGNIIIKDNTYFAPFLTLIIKPGTKILFEKKPDIPNTNWTKYADDFIKKHNDPTGKEGYNKSHFKLFGKIIAIGTKENPVIFTSSQKQPEYADWDQLILINGSKFDYVEVSYSHNGVNIDGENVVVKNSKIYNSL